MSLKHQLLGNKEKKLTSAVLFPRIAQVLKRNPQLVAVKGFFVVSVTQNKLKKDEWYLLFGDDMYIGQTLPSTSLKPVIIQLEDKYLLKFITGGLHGVQALAKGYIKIAGDAQMASELEAVFVKAGGVEKVRDWLKSKL